MTEKEEQFQSSKVCWIFEKLSENINEKVRDQYRITEKFRVAAHWRCKINFRLTMKKFL